jgi:hypothetical protein
MQELSNEQGGALATTETAQAIDAELVSDDDPGELEPVPGRSRPENQRPGV